MRRLEFLGVGCLVLRILIVWEEYLFPKNLPNGKMEGLYLS